MILRRLFSMGFECDIVSVIDMYLGLFVIVGSQFGLMLQSPRCAVTDRVVLS